MKRGRLWSMMKYDGLCGCRRYGVQDCSGVVILLVPFSHLQQMDASIKQLDLEYSWQDFSLLMDFGVYGLERPHSLIVPAQARLMGYRQWPMGERLSFLAFRFTSIFTGVQVKSWLNTINP